MLSLKKVREAYFNPAPGDPGRPLTREEMHARYERRYVDACLNAGLDPKAEGFGEHGSLIGGAGKPLTVFPARPERALRIHPLPLAWFDHPWAREPFPTGRDVEDAEMFFEGLAGDYLAGMPNRPSGKELRRMFRARSLNGRERSQVWHVFACMRGSDIPGLRWRGGLSAYEVGRAALLAETRRATVIRWLYQYALDPEGRDQASDEIG